MSEEGRERGEGEGQEEIVEEGEEKGRGEGI